MENTSVELPKLKTYLCILVNKEVSLDFEKPTNELVNLCILEIQDRVNIIANHKENLKSSKLKVRRRGIPKEIELFLNVGKYLRCFQEKNKNKKFPGIDLALDKVETILKDGNKLLNSDPNANTIDELVKNLRDELDGVRKPYFHMSDS